MRKEIIMKTEKLKRINPAMFTSDYGTIRAVRENDGILFVGIDVAKAFGHGSNRAIAYCYGTTKRRLEIREGDRVKSVVTATCITPDDCMQLYHFSKLDKADREAVKAFIFETIIPALNGDNAEFDEYEFEDSEEDREYIESGDFDRDTIKRIEEEAALLSKQLIDLRLDLYSIKYRDWQDEPHSLRRFFMRYLSGTPDKEGKTMSERFDVDNKFLDGMVLAVDSSDGVLNRVEEKTLMAYNRKSLR